MRGTRKFSVGLVQMAMASDPRENLACAVKLVRAAARDGARIVCLPELFRTRYFCQHQAPQHFDLAEEIPGPTTLALARVARQARVGILTPVFERRAAGLYHNTVVVLDERGAVTGLYRKMHIPDDPGYQEKYYFTPGDSGFRPFATACEPIGVLICWDQWFPEAARLVALHGAPIIFYPTAIGWHPREKAAQGPAQLDAWRTVQRGHAIANGVYVAAVNRVGFEPAPDRKGAGIEFWGSSFICDPFGVVLASASAGRAETLLAEVDLERLEEVRRNWPFWRDRRLDAYGGLTERFREGGADG